MELFNKKQCFVRPQVMKIDCHFSYFYFLALTWNWSDTCKLAACNLITSNCRFSWRWKGNTGHFLRHFPFGPRTEGSFDGDSLRLLNNSHFANSISYFVPTTKSFINWRFPSVSINNYLWFKARGHQARNGVCRILVWQRKVTRNGLCYSYSAIIRISNMLFIVFDQQFHTQLPPLNDWNTADTTLNSILSINQSFKFLLVATYSPTYFYLHVLV